MGYEPKVKRTKLLADGKTYSRPARLRTGEWITVESYDKVHWRWSVNMGLIGTQSVPGYLFDDEFSEREARHRVIVENYRRGRGFSEGIMKQVAVETV